MSEDLDNDLRSSVCDMIKKERSFILTSLSISLKYNYSLIFTMSTVYHITLIVVFSVMLTYYAFDPPLFIFEKKSWFDIFLALLVVSRVLTKKVLM
jgi:hypothetical protein